VSLVRLQKLISQYAVASRRKAEALIKQGRVKVDGEPVKTVGIKVPIDSRIEVDGVAINRKIPTVYLMLNKPPGYLCTRGEQHDRPVVYDLIDSMYADYGLFSVGRLDFLTEGLLLLTNDGDFAHTVSHPSGGVLKKYEVTTGENIPYKKIAAWKNGVYIRGERYAIHDFRKVTFKKVILTLAEGKNREIRRLFETIDVSIVRLKRIAIGSLELGALPLGQSRELKQDELERILQALR
jgi:23S rRNA pseudouridine2605 synthase